MIIVVATEIAISHMINPNTPQTTITRTSDHFTSPYYPPTDWQVKTEMVWALGKSPDSSAFPALVKLEQEIWAMPSKDSQLQQLREAVDWSIREVRQGGHTDDH